MNEWLLTDEEIKTELVGNGVEDSPYMAYACEVIAKAQARKLVEWLEQEMSSAPMGLRIARFEKCLEILRKEVGLEVKL